MPFPAKRICAMIFMPRWKIASRPREKGRKRVSDLSIAAGLQSFAFGFVLIGCVDLDFDLKDLAFRLARWTVRRITADQSKIVGGDCETMTPAAVQQAVFCT